jgi:CRP-like cAMP-binding protein
LFDKLKSLLDRYGEIPGSEWDVFTKKLKVQQFTKDSTLFSKGDHSRIVSFVASGLAYSYYTDISGNEKVKRFSWEGRMISPYSTLIAGTTLCNFSAKALEDSTLITINYSDLLEIYDRHFCWQRLGRRMAEDSLVERELREYQTLCVPLTERYEHFIKTHEAVRDRIPQYLIASFLGIHAVSLSRLRRRRLQELKK